MCAASVSPEPGSNSQIWFGCWLRQLYFCSHLSENFDSFLVLSNSGYLLYCIVLVSIWLFDRNSLGFSYFSLFTFQCTLALSFRVLLYYTNCIILCQHFLKTFLFYFLEQIFINKYLFFARVDNEYINTRVENCQQLFLLFIFIFCQTLKSTIHACFPFSFLRICKP